MSDFTRGQVLTAEELNAEFAKIYEILAQLGLGTGVVVMKNIPTSPVGLPPGTVWRNGDFLCIV